MTRAELDALARSYCCEYTIQVPVADRVPPLLVVDGILARTQAEAVLEACSRVRKAGEIVNGIPTVTRQIVR